MKFFVRVGAAVFLFLAFSFSVASAATLREELLFSVVQIVGINGVGEVFIGSGTTIGENGLVLTNHHVVTDESTQKPYESLTLCYTVSEYEEPRCAASAKVIAAHKTYDLALAVPDKKLGKDGKPTKESFKKYWKKTGQKFYAPPFKNPNRAVLPKILDRVTVWGYPNVGGGTVTVTSGFVSGFSVEEKKAGTFVKWVKTDTNINPGNSGGAVFNEHFLYAGIPSNSFLGQLGFFIPVQTAVEWLQDISKKKIIRLRDVTSLKTYAANFSGVEDEKLYDILILMKHLGLMGGAAEDLFNPDQAFTKGEAVASAMAAARRAAPFFEKPCVSAQNGDDAYRNEVCHAAEQGWISAKNFRAIDPAAESFFIDMLNKSFGKRMLRSHSDRVLSQADAAEILFGLIAE